MYHHVIFYYSEFSKGISKFWEVISSLIRQIHSCDNFEITSEVLSIQISPLKVNNYWDNSNNYQLHHPTQRENHIIQHNVDFYPNGITIYLDQKTHLASKSSKRIQFCYLHRINHPTAIENQTPEISGFFYRSCMRDIIVNYSSRTAPSIQQPLDTCSH